MSKLGVSKTATAILSLLFGHVFIAFSTLPSAAGTSDSQPADATSYSASAFTQSIGVDVALNGSAEDNAKISKLFAELGASVTRIAVLRDNKKYEENVRNFISENPHTRIIGLTNCAPPLGPYPHAEIDAGSLRDFESGIGGRLDYIEAVNEPNNTKDPNWATDTRTCLSHLERGTGATPIIGPALVARLKGEDERELGDLSKSIAYGNIHRYYSGRNPGTAGWGATDSCGKYGSLPWAMCLASENAASRPLVMTETGWNSDTEVDEETQAKYLLRALLVDWRAGIALTSIYVFRSYTGGDGFGGDGIVRADFTPKPAYMALKTFLDVLRDNGNSSGVRRPTPLPAVEISATTPDLISCIFAKRNGSKDVVLWREVQSADPDHRGYDLRNVETTATVKLTNSVAATLYHWNDDGTVTPSDIGRATKFTFEVSDTITVIELH